MSIKTSDDIKLRLYYWDCRGRVQAVRFMLEDIAYIHKNVDYKEDFEPLEKILAEWPQRKFVENISGPFQNLPVLHYNDTHIFGQTLTIGHFLARKFDLYGKTTLAIDDKDLLEVYINGVVSCAYTDVIVSVLICVFNGVDLENRKDQNYRLAKKIPADLKALNNLLRKSSTSFYYDQTEPTIADYFTFEAFTIARDYHQKLIPNEEDCQALIKLAQTMKERPGLANYFNKGLLIERITGSPKESEYRAKLAESQK